MAALLVFALLAASAAAVTPVVKSGDNLQLWECNPASGRQAWDLERSEKVVGVRGDDSLGWDISGDLNDTAPPGTPLHIWGVHKPPRGDQEWTFHPSTGQFVNTWGPCAAVSAAYPGIPLSIQPCNTSDSRQIFTYDNSSGVVSIPAADGSGPLCVDAGSFANCSMTPYSGYPYCNSSLPAATRAADLASRLNVADYANLLYRENQGVPRLGLGRISFNEALHGCEFKCGPAYTDPSTGYTSTGCPTSFPHVTLMGGAFNRSLWRTVASAISDEGRSLHNTAGYALITWSPDINPFRDPRWGRGQEVTGEDPTLMSEYIVQYAAGLQEGPDDRCIKLVSTAKHFSGYDLEHWEGLDRQSFTANISSHDLVSYFWPPFMAAAQRARVHSIMCSYNSVSLDGAPEVPSCAWSWANNDVIRNQWGWDGFIVSDCSAISDFRPARHNYTADLVHAAAAAVLGGTDVNCGTVYQNYLVDAVTSGLLTMEDLVVVGTRFFSVVFATGLYDPPDACDYNSYGPDRVDTPAHRELAKEAAIQGIALLANDDTSTPWGKGPLLPLKASALAGKTVAVIGPNANSTQGLLSIYHGTNTVVNSQSVLQGLQRRAAADGFDVTYSLGCTWTCSKSTGFDQAAKTASAADVVILVVGLYPGKPFPDGGPIEEAEGDDRYNLTLPGLQPELVKLIVSVGKPVVLVLIHGGPLALDDTALAIPTILDAHYPGEMGGDAVTAVLFGDVSASGRLTTTVYPTEFVNQRNLSDYALAAHTDAYGQQIPGVTYLYYGGPMQWPFGFGLSYTTFAYSWVNASDAARSVDVSNMAALPSYAVNVKNTGTVTSDVSALAFLSNGIAGEPIMQLFDFQRASAVAPGESVTMLFSLSPDLAGHVTAAGSRVLSPGTKITLRIGDVPRDGSPPSVSASGSFVTGVLDLTGSQDVVLYALPPRK